METTIIIYIYYYIILYIININTAVIKQSKNL
jgi:hypothetical protein